MPNTEPVALHRSPSMPAAPHDVPAAPAPRSGGQGRSPDTVYSFLAEFTAGVQRGFDDLRRTDRGPS